MDAGVGMLLMVLTCGEPVLWVGASESEQIPTFVLRHDAYEAGVEPGAAFVTYLSASPLSVKAAFETVPEDKQFLCDQQA
jgi:hypothetical protein